MNGSDLEFPFAYLGGHFAALRFTRCTAVITAKSQSYAEDRRGPQSYAEAAELRGVMLRGL